MTDETRPKTKDAKRKHREDLLDEALAQSFPASDPPSIVRSRPKPREAED
jgi:hypothetical protein